MITPAYVMHMFLHVSHFEWPAYAFTLPPSLLQNISNHEGEHNISCGSLLQATAGRLTTPTPLTSLIKKPKESWEAHNSLLSVISTTHLWISSSKTRSPKCTLVSQARIVASSAHQPWLPVHSDSDSAREPFSHSSTQLAHAIALNQ